MRVHAALINSSIHTSGREKQGKLGFYGSLFAIQKNMRRGITKGHFNGTVLLTLLFRKTQKINCAADACDLNGLKSLTNMATSHHQKRYELNIKVHKWKRCYTSRRHRQSSNWTVYPSGKKRVVFKATCLTGYLSGVQSGPVSDHLFYITLLQRIYGELCRTEFKVK